MRVPGNKHAVESLLNNATIAYQHKRWNLTLIKTITFYQSLVQYFFFIIGEDV